MKNQVLLIASILAVVGCVAAGEDKPVEKAKPEAIVTEAYDVRSLVLEVPDYPMPSLNPHRSSGGGSGGGMFGSGGQPHEGAAPDRQHKVDDVIKLITATVAPESWRDAGGTLGAIGMVNGQLFVSQTAANQQAVQSVLTKLRSDAHQTLHVEATWLLLSPAELATVKRQPGQESLAQVPEELLKTAKVYCRGQVTMFNGQLNHILSTTTKSYISDLTPVVGTGAVGYDPTMDTLTTGVGLQIRTQLEDSGSVLVDLSNEVVDAPQAGGALDLKQIADAAPHATTLPSKDTPGFLDGTRIIYQTLHTTARIPLGAPVLIGGMTLDPGGKDTPGRELYLVLRLDADKK